MNAAITEPTRVALATVVSDDFLPGALVMLRSFTDANPWFAGESIVIHNGLSAKNVETLERYVPDVLFRVVGDQLRRRMEAIAQSAGWRSPKQLQFASLEAFALTRYDLVIFCDSDLLFLDSIDELLAIDAALIACPDGANFRKNLRRTSNFCEISPEDADPTKAIGNTFNSGMMLLKPHATTRKTYEQLVGMMDTERWRGDTTGHTDQMLLNIHFAGRQKIADVRYNYLLSHRELIERTTGVAPERAKVLHFTGPAKPWLPVERLARLGIDQAFLTAVGRWRERYRQLESGERNGPR